MRLIHDHGISKEILAAILNGIDEGIHVVDLKGHTIYYNDIAAKHDGLNVNEVIGKPLLTVFPSLSEQTSTLLKVMKTNKPIFNETQSYVNIHGDKIETINTTLPISVDGQIAGAVEIAKDYSRLKLLSESLLDLRNMVNKPNKQKKSSRPTIQYTLESLLTKSEKMKGIKEEAKKLAKSESPILVFGESGSGKELFVQGIHHASLRPDAPFIAQNCAAIPESLLESVLFGTTKGSYTGALDRPGLFELADGGTLFLDEIHAMPIELQAKLLRVLEDGQVRRIGSTTSSYVNFRVIAAMNIHPQLAMERQKIRTDLFYRLNVLTFELLPLRDRKEDILFLADQFITSYNQQFHKSIAGLDEGVKGLFLQYKWPGNVRELKHTIEYMMNVCESDTLCEEDLPLMLKQISAKDRRQTDKKKVERSLRAALFSLEKELIDGAMQDSEGNILKAAKLLGIPRQTLQYKLQKIETVNAE